MIDRLRLANRLVQKGMSRRQAEALATALYEAMSPTSIAFELQELKAEIKATGVQLIAVWAALMIPLWFIAFWILITI